MNYKKMALVLFLVPLMSCASNVQETIKQLEQQKLEKENEIDSLGDTIQDTSMKFIDFCKLTNSFWTADENQHSFYEFMEEVKDKVLKGKDAFSFIKECKFLGETDPGTIAAVLRLVLKGNQLEKKIDQYNLLVQELLLINEKISNIK